MEETIKVFLADSSAESIQMLRATLEREGVSVVGSARNGEDALQLLRALRPDVLLTELVLPGLDGLSLLRALRLENRMPRTIVISAFWNDGTARAAGLLGVDYYLPKPCRVEALIRCVRELAKKPGDRRPTPPAAVRDILMRFPIPAHLNGYLYLCAGLELVLQDRNYLQGVTKSLYRDLARRFRTTDACIERSMRAAIASGWEQGTPERRAKEFGHAFEGCARPPTITRFLSIMSERMLLEHSDREL